ncbi:hypothetical protein GUITHDRAFT_161409 [Guillardia theta CCMP2712]|uniref:SGNH hydrolase-type esterase domain-containing protein n=1 Tax=Guillardia theta (strain CCMP2712) TaxID=905079 RepID=L1JT70_GUITC|nr:hypothetical protein GUITHDRAFT_161409 [Guillardia theta CCMP2712]EKX51761.1 hypothetical protein GUITHDRAFT_161409 [Guillardia theta CCMP2712]|eukprot:XP_005838741.1 hypothetical protein GUITHDRAFT_161409 [Guillardia theta CCMP2712]
MAVPGGAYYSTYHGHDESYLKSIIASLRRSHGSDAAAIFLAGDSTLDNKHWLFRGGQSAQSLIEDQTRGAFTAAAVNGYEAVLEPTVMVKDVCYWMNYELADKKVKSFVVNTAVEATTLTSRTGGFQCCCMPACGSLQAQDELIRQNLTERDYLVVSVGGNDIALAPSICTVIALLTVMITPWFLLGWLHPSVLYLQMIFRYQLQSYVKKLVENRKPAKIAVCMVYNLDEQNNQSWANSALYCLCYHCAPGILQYRMRIAFELGVSKVKIPGVREVVPIHLADALDGKDTRDYVARVEPSIQGGRKIACLILSKLGLIESKHV